MPDQSQIRQAPEEITLYGVRLHLIASVSRDLMPSAHPDRRLGALFRIEASSPEVLREEVKADLAWFINSNEVWQATVSKERLSETRVELITRDGPEWDDEYVDIVVRIIDRQGKAYLLQAKHQHILTLW